MDAISKPNIDKIVENVKAVLRSGLFSVYDIVQLCANSVNHCIDWVNANGSAMVDAENERRTAETAREAWFNENKNKLTGNGYFVNVNEKGFYVCDKNLNIGFKVTDDGCKGVGLVNYKEE